MRFGKRRGRRVKKICVIEMITGDPFTKPNMKRLIPLTVRISRIDYSILLKMSEKHNLTVSKLVREIIKLKIDEDNRYYSN